jgi:DNA-binding Lrp family transcriptional regulator
VHAFEAAVEAVPNVLRAQRLFGDPDYLLQVIARDLPAFQRLYDERLAALPGVQRLTSTLVMKNVVIDRPLPL